MLYAQLTDIIRAYEKIKTAKSAGLDLWEGIFLGLFILKLINRIFDGMETKLDTLDDKVQTSLDTMEERVTTKLDSQYGIIVALIDRVRALDNQSIRQDVLLKTLLGVPNLIDIDKIAKADRDDQRKD